MARFTLLLLFLFCACSDSTSSAGDGGGGGKAPSSSAIGKADLNGIFEMQSAALADITRTIDKINDGATAKAAAPKLDKLADRLEKIAARRNDLFENEASPEDKMAFGQSAMGFLGEAGTMGDQFARLEEVPGVREALEPVMTRIMEAMSFSGN